jgi:uridine kinase
MRAPSSDRKGLVRMGLPYRAVVSFVTNLVNPAGTVLVGIDGGAGSGKTTFARWLAESIRETNTPVSLVHVDCFYRPVAKRVGDFPTLPDCDWERIRDKVILPLQAGQPARFQRYNWPEDRLKDWVAIDVGGVTIIEGVNSMRNELSDFYDLRIWFSCARDVRVSRMLARRDTSAEEIRHWLPVEEQYISSHAPEERAHLVINSSADMDTKDGEGWVVIRWAPPSTR